MKLLIWLAIGISTLMVLAVGCGKWLRWAARQSHKAEEWERYYYHDNE